MNNYKAMLSKWGEDTAYSAKCHFKSADIRRITITTLIFINIIFSILTLSDLLEKYHFLLQLLSIISLFASFWLFVIESTDGKDNSKNHMYFGNLYLTLHNDLYVAFMKNDLSEIELNKLQERLNELNMQDKPMILFPAKWIAAVAIEKKKEMIIWWK